MDHVIERIEVDLYLYFDEFKEEYTSNEYSNFSECPSYEPLKALIDSSNILRKYLGWDRLSIKELLELDDIEIKRWNKN